MKTTAERQEKEVSSVLNRLKDIATAVMRAAEGNTVSEVLERIAQASRELAHARYAALGVPDGEGGLQFFKFSGLDDETAALIGHLPEGRGLLGEIMHQRAPIRIEHIKSHPRSSGFPPNHPPMDRFLGVPIQVGSQLFGMLYLTDRLDGLPFDERDQWLIETLAGYAALAIAGAQLREQQQKLTLLMERERISMDLHDGVIQSLYAVGMNVELMRVTGDTNPESLKGITKSLNNVIDDIRSYILNLQSEQTDQRSIRMCFEIVLKRLHLPSSLNVILNAPEMPMPFSRSTSEAICQMATEAISNVVRHADAQTLILTAEIRERVFHLHVTDDGKGFDVSIPTETSGRHGLGLRNLSERARMMHGKVDILSKPDSGTELTITLPINM